MSFALNNAAARRGVVSGSASQGMVVTVPLGIVCFLPIVIALGDAGRLLNFPPVAAAWMAGVGLLHFIFGRYSNYRANQAAGVNLTAPVVQLQVVVTLVLAVIILKEPCTLLQAAGGVLILAGSIVTQRQSFSPRPAGTGPAAAAGATFKPRQLMGYTFAILAALAYGSSPILARFALADTSPATGLMGGLIAYIAATLFVAVILLWRPLRRDVMALTRENLRWFAYSGVFVAAAQGFFFAAIAVAPVMLVIPILQMSLVFRIVFSTWLTPDHEVFGPVVMTGVAITIVGALSVSIDTSLIVGALMVPDAIARVLLWQV
jgi:drug/metabolite transporter (DMT)-like permease